MRASDLRQHVRSELLSFAWSQWAQMGVLAAAPRHDRWAADPEALLLFTLPLARSDPRLFDEVLDWVRLNGRLLSVQRLRSLAESDPEARRLAQAALAWAGARNPSLRQWASRPPAEPPGAVVPLFIVEGEPLHVREPDPTFSAHGWIRPVIQPSGKSRPPDPRRGINLAFRLRLLFGIGVRAEAMRVLLTTDHPELTALQVAEAAAFSKRNVTEGLGALAEAGVITAAWRRNERVYRVDRERWAALLGLEPRDLPRFVDWIRLLPALLAILRWLDEDARLQRSDYIRASEARRFVDQVRPALIAAGVQLPDDRGVGPAESWPSFERTVASALRMIRPPSQGHPEATGALA